jgi:DNA-binding Lrp family transcriptional regulator
VYGEGDFIMELTAFDKNLLNLLQGHLPVCSRPFARLAKELGTEEGVVLQRVQALKQGGFLRRIGTFFDSNKLGYKGTLVALRVEPERLASVAEAINRYPGATHNYEREGKYNLWFTLLTPSPEQEQDILSEVGVLPGVQDILNLKAKHKYKINVQFKLQ